MIRIILPALAAAFLTFQPTIGRSQPPESRADLALVPADALFMAHVKVADIWRSEPFKDVREMVQRAGPKALETYTKRFPVSPAIVDRVTVFVIPGPADNPNRVPAPLVIFAMNKPIDQATLVSSLMPDGKLASLSTKRYFIDARGELAMHIIDQRTFIVSELGSVEAYISHPKAANGPMDKVKEGANNHHVTAALNVTALPPEAMREIPPPFQPIAKAHLAGLTIDVGTEIAVQLGLRYADADSAIAAEKAAREGIAMARAEMQKAKKEVGRALLEPQTPSPATMREFPEAAASLAGLAAIGNYDELLQKFPLFREDSNLVVRIKVPMHPGGAMPLGLAAAGAAAYFGFARDAAMAPGLPGPPVGLGGAFQGPDGKSINNLKQFGLAMHNYAAVYNNFPAHAIYSKDGNKPLLSWRVAVLPYLEQDNLYQQFKLDEPWDSEHNKALIARMPEIYVSPNAPPSKERGVTHYQMFVGGGAAWAKQAKGPQFAHITDGLSNTIMLTEAANPVTWTKPDDIDYDPKKPMPKLGVDPNGTLLFLMMDGAAMKKPRSIAEDMLRAAISAAGGEELDWHSDRRPQAQPPRAVPTPEAKSKAIPPPPIPPKSDRP